MNKSYDGVRAALIDFAGLALDKSTVLDVGCYRGSNARYLKGKYEDILYVGLEIDPVAISKIDPCVDEVVESDLDSFTSALLAPRIFDLVILGDVIEHLKDPGSLLKELKKVTHAGSTVLISIPNVQYYETFLMLLIGRFPRRERGIFDKTHLRWFTRREFVNLVKDDYQVTGFKRVFRLIERPSKVNRLVPLFLPLLWVFAPFFTFQMYFSLKKL